MAAVVARAASSVGAAAVTAGNRAAGAVSSVAKAASSVMRATTTRMATSGGEVSNETSEINIGPKISQQMSNRGWTAQRIQDAVSSPVRVVKTIDSRYNPEIGTRLNDPATAYYHAEGGYVVTNDATGDVVQIQNLYKGEWKAPWD